MMKKLGFVWFLSLFCLAEAADALVPVCRDGNRDGLYSAVLVDEFGNEGPILARSIGSRFQCSSVLLGLPQSQGGLHAACRDGNRDGLYSVVLVDESNREHAILMRAVGENRECVRALTEIPSPYDGLYPVCRDGNGDGRWSTVLVDSGNNEILILNSAIASKSGCNSIIRSYPEATLGGFVACRDGNRDGFWSIVVLDRNGNEGEILSRNVGSKSECIKQIARWQSFIGS